jgi:tetratricopeptide (TPR) repeat protein
MRFLLPSLEEEKPRGKKRWSVWVAAVALLVLLGLLPEIASTMRASYARKLAAAGEGKILQKKYEAALSLAEEALARNPQNIRALRVGMNAGVALGRPKLAYGFGFRLVHSSGATMEDRYRFGRLALELGRTEEAQEELGKLQAASPEGTMTQRLGAMIWQSNGKPRGAIEAWQRILEEEPADIEAQLNLARLLMASSQVEEMLEGKAILGRLANLRDQTGITALRLLVETKELTLIEARMAQELLGNHPLRRATDELLLAELEIILKPYRRQEIQSEVAAMELPMKERAEWLLKQGAFEEVLQLTGGGDKSPEALLAHLEALGGLGRWKDVEKIVEEPSTPLAGYLRKVYLARSAMGLQQEKMAQLYWAQARAMAKGNAQLLAEVGEWAEKCNAWSEAAAAWRQILDLVPERRKIWEKIVWLSARENDTRFVRQALQQMAVEFPEDISVQNDLCYFQLLLREEMEECKKKVERIFKERPELISVRATLALACLRTGDLKGAKEMFEELTLRWGDLSPSTQVVYIAVLGNAGLEKEAEELAGRMDQGVLRQEELALIEGYLREASREPSRIASREKKP